jgi:hypothetical protein
VPVSARKTEGPMTQLTFLGIPIDTEAMSLSLAPDKLAHILPLVLAWRSCQAATRPEFQSLISHLSHAAFVVLLDQTVLCRMVDSLKTTRIPTPCRTDSRL